jgi:hypothetical protein
MVVRSGRSLVNGKMYYMPKYEQVYSMMFKDRHYTGCRYLYIFSIDNRLSYWREASFKYRMFTTYLEAQIYLLRIMI